MKILKTLFLFGVALILITSCASSYKSISPERLNYGSPTSENDINIAYQTNVLSTSGNKKLAKKESGSYIKVIAVRITNNTNDRVVFGQDMMLKSGNVPLSILTPSQITANIKQSSAAYLLYLLLTPMTLQIGDQRTGDVESYNIGYGVGPGLALLNMGVASGANSNFESELETYSMINREIAPGETVYGLVGLSNFSYGLIEIEEM